MGSIFKFKQFEVDQSGCAMKINTDGVLLAALAYDLQPKHIIDIGTGTGVIALMLAQGNPDAIVYGVEIDREASERAGANFKNSPFHQNISIHCADFSHYQPTQLVDLIISNPPFYTNSLHNPDERKKLAKHTDELFFENLMLFADNYLTEHGVLQIIVPTALSIIIKDSLLSKHELFVQKEWLISSFADQEPIRVILRIGRNKTLSNSTTFYIYEHKNEYSSSYKELLKPYFLAF